MRVPNWLAAYFLLATGGCVSTQSVADRLATQYIGRSLDEFVLSYGIPSRKFVLASGDIAYVWNSGTASVPMPATATTTAVGNTATTNVVGGGSIDMFCEVQFVTSPEGTVKSLRILQDTIGFWTTSRCNELFKRTR